MALTKQDLAAIEGVLDKKLEEKLGTRLLPIEKNIDKLHARFLPIEKDIKEVKDDTAGIVYLRQDIEEIKRGIGGLREQIQRLAITLDNFFKMMTDYQEEFAILKGEIDQIKKILKEKLGVEIAIQK